MMRRSDGACGASWIAGLNPAMTGKREANANTSNAVLKNIQTRSQQLVLNGGLVRVRHETQGP